MRLCALLGRLRYCTWLALARPCWGGFCFFVAVVPLAKPPYRSRRRIFLPFMSWQCLSPVAPCAAANVLFDAIFLIIFNTIFLTPSLHCCLVQNRFALYGSSSPSICPATSSCLFQYSLPSSPCNSPVAFSSVLQRGFSCARRVFRSGVLLIIFSCPRSSFFPQWYLPAFAAFSAAVFCYF